MDRTWLEVEMDETLNLMRKRLEILNDLDADDMDCDDVHEFHHIYQTIEMIKKMMAASA